MKKEFINPAIRVIKIDGSKLMSGSDVHNEQGGPTQQAPTRASIFEDSEF